MAPSLELPGIVFFYLILVAAIALFGYAVTDRQLLSMLRGRRENRLGSARDLWQRALGLVTLVLSQGRMAKRWAWYGGLLHVLIFWGFLVLQVRTLDFLLDGIHEEAGFQAWLGGVYTGFRPVMDLFNLLVIVGTLMAAHQRLFLRPPRLTFSRDAWVILGLIFFLMLSDVGKNASLIALGEVNDGAKPDWAPFSFLAYGVAVGIDGWNAAAIEAFHTGMWYWHLLIFVAFLDYLPYSKHSHVFTVAPNVFFRRTKPTGYLAPINLDALLAEPVSGSQGEPPAFGVGKWQDFTWKQMLDSYTCTECGRCEVNCPAFLSGKELSPKEIEHSMRSHLTANRPAVLPFLKDHSNGQSLIEAVGFNAIWDCVTCGACMEQCPVLIEHVPEIMDMRRSLVMEEARMPETARATLLNLEQRGHPWRGTTHTRSDWLQGMGIPLFDGTQEYLLWVGCSGALSDRNIPITQALARLLQQAGVSFGVLAEEETCSGDPARRLGNEYLFQVQARQNIATFQQKGVQKVITPCPHCFNVMKNEYPDFDGVFEVHHHTQVLQQLVEAGRLQPTEPLPAGRGGGAQRITYHDPCYMGRHNRSFEPARQLIARLPNGQAVEMEWNRQRALCCGAGGAHMWVEESKGRRINHMRTEHAYDSGADTVATGCPFCIQMFEDGIPTVEPGEGRRIRAFDVAELLEVTVLGRRAGSEARAP